MPDYGRVLLTVFLCMVLAACGFPRSARDTGPALQDANTARQRGVWFCQANIAWDGWNCARDPRLALSPVPARPPKSPQALPDTIAMAPAGDAVAELTPEPPQTVAKPVQPDAGGMGMEATATGSPPASAAPAVRNPQPEEEPDWQHLAYRPAAVTPLKELPGQFYTVQIVAMSSMDALESFRAAHRLSGVLGARVEAGGKIYYALLLGVYETLADAKAAAASRPGSLAHIKPWIRKLGPLQAAVARADVQANAAGN